MLRRQSVPPMALTGTDGKNYEVSSDKRHRTSGAFPNPYFAALVHPYFKRFFTTRTSSVAI